MREFLERDFRERSRRSQKTVVCLESGGEELYLLAGETERDAERDVACHISCAIAQATPCGEPPQLRYYASLMTCQLRYGAGKVRSIFFRVFLCFLGEQFENILWIKNQFWDKNNILKVLEYSRIYFFKNKGNWN